MQETGRKKIPLPFLQGGGEMGEKMRNHNWSQSLVGEPENWPQNLRIYLSLLLNSRFPMFLFWGPESICFYNDAYRPSLGDNGKHPGILGMPGKEAWPEIWDFIGPLIQKILEGGEAIWYEDQYLPIFRNGQMEDVYWTFSYSPVTDESGNPAGVFVTCTETTKSVTSFRQLQESESYLEILSNTVPAMIFYVDKDQRYRSYNQRFMEWFNVGPKEVIGKTVFEFVGEKAYQMVFPHLSRAYNGEQEQYEMRSPARMNDNRWLRIVYTPHKSEEGEVLGVIVHATDITERKESEIALRESEERIRTLIEEAPIAICFFTGREMKIELANRLTLEAWGTDHSVIGMRLEDAVPSMQQEPYLSILDKVFTSGETFSDMAAPVRLIVNGIPTTRYYNYTFKPLLNDSGEVYGILDMAVDVTEQVLVQQRIEESRRELLSSFNDSPVGLALITGDDLVFKMVNPFYASLTGRPAEELIDKPLLTAMPELSGQGFDDRLRKVMKTGEPYMAKEDVVRVMRNGEEVTMYIEHTYQPQRNEGGDIIAVLVVVMDITQQILSRHNIEEKEAALRNAVELAELGTWSLDIASKLATLSHRHMEMLGLDSPIATPEKLLSIIVENDRHKVENAFYTAVKPDSESRYEAEYELVNEKTGEQRIVRALGQVYFDKNMNPVKIAGTAQDITTQRRTQFALEAEVKKRTKQLAEANESLNNTIRELNRSNTNLEEFAHAASHDLKEPIRKIHFFTQHLKTQLNPLLQETHLSSFARIEKATERMVNLIDDLLLYSHVSERPLEMESIDLNQKIQNVLDDLELDIQEKKASINIGNLPVIKGYRRQLQQLFQNLISNALKYSKADVAPLIDISATIISNNGQHYHLIMVKDNGIGFEQIYADKIFQMFTRLHGRTEYSGTGVGLSIVKKVVENHNGFISAESIPGQGTTFNVHFPV